MRRKKFVSMLLVATMAATLFAGCGNDSGKKGGTETGSAKEFDAFFAVPGSEINDDNEIQKIIEEKTGVRVNETWLTGQTADEAIGTMIAGGEYPDFIDGISGQKQLYDAGALVPLDDYIEKYPNSFALPVSVPPFLPLSLPHPANSVAAMVVTSSMLTIFFLLIL